MDDRIKRLRLRQLRRQRSGEMEKFVIQGSGNLVIASINTTHHPEFNDTVHALRIVQRRRSR